MTGSLKNEVKVSSRDQIGMRKSKVIAPCIWGGISASDVCLSHKHKDPSLVPRTDIRKLSMETHPCNLSAGEMETGMPGAGWLVNLA